VGGPLQYYIFNIYISSIPKKMDYDMSDEDGLAARKVEETDGHENKSTVLLDGDAVRLEIFRNESLHGNVASMCLPGREKAERRRSLVAKGKMIPCPLCCDGIGVKHVLEGTDCALCKGERNVSEWVRKYEIVALSESESDDEPLSCPICFEEAQYGISTECTHFYCGHCIKSYLESCLETGDFPAFCPACRQSGKSDEQEHPHFGRITEQGLTFLFRRGVVSNELRHRFMKQQLRGVKEFFKCPAKGCERFLRYRPPVLVRKIYETGKGNATKMVNTPGVCPCGAAVCLQCRLQLKDSESHLCSNAKDGEKVNMSEIYKAANGLGVICPACGFFVLKNGGCDVVSSRSCPRSRLHRLILSHRYRMRAYTDRTIRLPALDGFCVIHFSCR